VLHLCNDAVIRDAAALAALPIHLSRLGMTTTWRRKGPDSLADLDDHISSPGEDRRAPGGQIRLAGEIQVGAFDAALGLLETVGTDSLDDPLRAHVELLRSHIAFASGLGREARP
jgi:hypothetical protein